SRAGGERLSSAAHRCGRRHGVTMRKRFVFACEDQPGEAWRTRFAAGREEAERWYLGGAAARLIESFLVSPLYSRRRAFPTVYSAVYRPAEGRVDYIWPGQTVTQRIGQFEEGEYTHDVGELER